MQAKCMYMPLVKTILPCDRVSKRVSHSKEHQDHETKEEKLEAMAGTKRFHRGVADPKRVKLFQIEENYALQDSKGGQKRAKKCSKPDGKGGRAGETGQK